MVEYRDSSANSPVRPELTPGCIKLAAVTSGIGLPQYLPLKGFD